MNDYYSVRIDATPCNEDITDLAASFLADSGFESFLPDETGLSAFIPVAAGGAATAEIALADFPIPTVFSISETFVKGEDWNSEWEKNYFKPIVVGDECVVHSSFHTDVPAARYDIVIDPKMAFGTGHHDTTSNMMRLILSSDMEGKSVIDMGTGTGILAILAAMRGAAPVVGIEIDEPAYENAVENARLNGVDVKFYHGDAACLDKLEPADYLFANINRNIILADIDRYYSHLKHGGLMFLSGFYEKDVEMIESKADEYGLREKRRIVSDSDWTALELEKI